LNVTVFPETVAAVVDTESHSLPFQYARYTGVAGGEVSVIVEPMSMIEAPPPLEVIVK